MNEASHHSWHDREYRRVLEDKEQELQRIDYWDVKIPFVPKIKEAPDLHNLQPLTMAPYDVSTDLIEKLGYSDTQNGFV